MLKSTNMKEYLVQKHHGGFTLSTNILSHLFIKGILNYEKFVQYIVGIWELRSRVWGVYKYYGGIKRCL